MEGLPLLHGATGAVYLSIMEPGTQVRPHCGPSNLRLRYHLALEADPGARIRVGSEWRSWRAGECLIFDDSFEHEVVHEGSCRRVILLVDCWRPELDQHERTFLQTLYRRLRGLPATMPR